VIDSSLYAQVQSLPKIELHRHLEGALRLTTLLDIAREHDIDLPKNDLEALRPYVQVVAGEPRSADNFLGKFRSLRLFFRSEAIIRRIAYESVIDAADDNIRYMELRFTPQALSNLLGCDYRDVIGWVTEATADACRERDIDVRLIVSMNRHESVEIGQATLDAALEAGSRVVGIDLAGREADFSARPFRSLFERAKTGGLGVTIHAGEWAGADSVREALFDLEADRIGHGVRCGEAPDVLEAVVARGVWLEVCPSSNVDSGVVPSLDVHPLPALYRAGVRTTINTDDPGVSNITLSDEIARLLTETTLTMADIQAQMTLAAQAAFLRGDEHARLIARFSPQTDA
jgi:adenosine deaminase